MHQELAYFLHRANEASTAREGGYSMQIKAYLLLFLQCLYAHRIKAAAPSESGHEDIVRNTISFVKANYRHSISIDEAAAAAGFSRNHFMRVFHQETGETFITYLNRYRLEVAANLLRSTNSSVNDIAVESGFDNFSYFIRLFKKQYHTSPGRYRRSIFR
ncbi:MAG: helix-turn-helix transcriptional regulator [Erysipelotrichaceae bacterium]|nr:helix-turn-helix transcriptional regulator [Lactimicrobium massiliense]MCH4019319.1 helix-turn-helix transcriptional regulator [Erysipelotrichaceae bacterium]MCH4045686.1 helix-turn-helix transcriptional regulator [Erysipelotrichaceae bacterium]MCH4122895.1 helix-turn-helix transcriptional regulator [Erysipelotrichaceae bacterium]